LFCYLKGARYGVPFEKHFDNVQKVKALIDEGEEENEGSMNEEPGSTGFDLSYNPASLCHET
jgi:hypothetical protein